MATFWGNPFVINQVTSNQQFDQQVATLNSGRSVVAWFNIGENGGDVKFRILNADGTEVLAETRANVATSGSQSVPKIAALAGGGFVLVWEDFTNGSSTGIDIRYRVFDANGSPVSGANDLTATASTANQRAPSVVGTPDGGFVIAWEDNNLSVTGLSSSSAVMARAFNAQGVAQGGGPTRVSDLPFGGDTAPAMVNIGGSLAIVWDDNLGITNGAGSQDGIYGRFYTLAGGSFAGATAGPTFSFDTGQGVEGHRDADVAFVGTLGTTYAVVWTNQMFPETQSDIFLNIGGVISTVNTATAGVQEKPSIAKLPNGGFVVVWQDTAVSAIKARFYDANGAATTAEIDVSQASAPRTTPDVSVASDGRVFVTYSGSGVSLSDIFGRFLDPRTAAINAAGTNADDVMVGTPFNDTILSSGGNDRVFGGVGSDFLYGGGGDDVMVANGSGLADADAYDVLFGEAGIDVISLVGGGKMYAAGGEGNDVIVGGDSTATGGTAEYLFGDGGDDYLVGGDGDDVLVGSNYEETGSASQFDVLIAGAGNDYVLQGAHGRGYLAGGDGADTLAGAAGVDSIDPGKGADFLFGGGGSDYFSFAAADLEAGVFDQMLDFTAGTDFVLLTGVAPANTSFGSFAGGAAVFVTLAGGVHSILAPGATVEGLQAGTIFL